WVVESHGRMRIATSDYFPEGAPTLKCSGMILFADINGDGLQDIVFSEEGSDPTGPGGRIGVALNLGGGKYRDVSALIPEDQWDDRAGSIAVGDVYGDGRVEIVLPDSNDGANTALLRWNGNGFDEIRNWVPLSLWKDYPSYLKQQSSMVMSDFDQDGRQDLLVGGQDHNPNFQILYGGPGGFTSGSLVTLPDGPFGHNLGGPITAPVFPTTAEVIPVLVADFNNDGRPDIFAIERQEILYQPGVYTDTNDPGYAYIRANGGWVVTDSTFQLLANAGSRRFTEVKSAPTWVNLGRREFTNLYAVDMNNDGFLDVVGLYQTDPYAGVGTIWGTTLFLNDGTGAFQIVDGSEVLAAVTTTPSNGQLWNLGAFVPTVVNRQRTEGIVYESVGGCGGPGFCPATGLNLYKVVADGSLGTGPNFVDPASLGVPGFNEFYYLRHYPDAAAAVQAGQYPSGLAHYLAAGKAKGYLPHAPLGLGHLHVDPGPPVAAKRRG
ncbi:MAG TPA: VCBS repeat-containing protein, partial [Thermoanaerobaculia bacterium]|nr:VCBS repeat-containing protein [Thermoanaerobaculia bacterium]